MPGYAGAFVRRHQHAGIGDDAAYGDWLSAAPKDQGEFLRQYPADLLAAGVCQTVISMPSGTDFLRRST